MFICSARPVVHYIIFKQHSELTRYGKLTIMPVFGPGKKQNAFIPMDIIHMQIRNFRTAESQVKHKKDDYVIAPAYSISAFMMIPQTYFLVRRQYRRNIRFSPVCRRWREIQYRKIYWYSLILKKTEKISKRGYISPNAGSFQTGKFRTYIKIGRASCRERVS